MSDVVKLLEESRRSLLCTISDSIMRAVDEIDNGNVKTGREMLVNTAKAISDHLLKDKPKICTPLT